ncbi:MAG: type II secretion protein F, partial [Microbacterium sp.]
MIWLTDAATAVLLGGAFGLGAWVLLMLIPRVGAPTLARRVAPYLRDVTDAQGTTVLTAVTDPGDAIAGALAAIWRAAQSRAVSLLGGSDGVTRRLAQAGSSLDLIAFRGRQLAAGLIGFATGILLVIVLAVAGLWTGRSLILPLVLALAGLAGSDLLLSVRAKARSARIAEELPTVLDFLALCLAAGEGIFDSLARVSTLGHGELTAELRSVVVDVRTGDGLPDALSSLARRVQVPAVGR